MSKTIAEYFVELEKQRTTLRMINQLLSKLDPNEIALIAVCDLYDEDRIGAIRAFLEVERDLVQSNIDCLLNGSVSGTDEC